MPLSLARYLPGGLQSLGGTSSKPPALSVGPGPFLIPGLLASPALMQGFSPHRFSRTSCVPWMSFRRPWPLPRWAGFPTLGRHSTASCKASPLATPSRQADSPSPRTARSYLRPASSRSDSHQPVFFGRVLLTALVTRTASTTTRVARLVSTHPAERSPVELVVSRVSAFTFVAS